MDRRDLLRGALGAAALSGVRAAAASTSKPGAGVLTVGEYLARAALLVDETRRAQDWVGSHPGDVGLASMALDLAEARSHLAVQIGVPDAAKQAHMHLLLALENTSASFDSLVRGDGKRAAQRMSAARIEAQTLALALEAAKLKLPVVK